MNLIWTQYADFLDHLTLLWALILLPVGLLILIKGADWLVDGAVAVAKQFGLSPLIIGLTIVAMGTSAPEVAASIQAALDNSPGIAVGNVYGSNIANLALVCGLCALIRPIAVSRAALMRDIPLMLAVACGLYPIFYNHTLTRFESIGMLVVFGCIIVFMIQMEKKRAQSNVQVAEQQRSAVEHAAAFQPQSLFISLCLIGIGLVCLAEGAGLTVASAKTIGIHAGLSDAVVGVTIVAIGTSLPELLTCLIASLKGHDDLSIGNLVGSNIFNTLLVIGASGVVKPYSIAVFPELTGSYYIWMLSVLFLFSGLAFVFKKITKPAGMLLVLSYVIYIMYSLGFFAKVNNIMTR
ncbi:MAG: calcium/sodium antiporter [Planctomycetota bacterium]|jgi:cation:H+ antiporter